MRYALLAATMYAAISTASNAATIITFGQSGLANTVTGIANASGSHIRGEDIPVTITQIDSGAVTPPVDAFLYLAGDSTSGATTGLVTVQHFDGDFEITSGIGNTGINYLSGAFDDATFGIRAGTGLTLTAFATFTSDVISTLGLPRNFSLSFTNVTPLLGTSGAQLANSADCGPPFDTVGCNDTGATIAAFTASVSGNASANVPEPMTLTLLGVGLLGLGMVRRARNR
jgi:PEP-CTERM motif